MSKTFKQFITEEGDIVARIKAECGEYLQKIAPFNKSPPTHMLWHAQKNRGNAFYMEFAPRKAGRDTIYPIHMALNRYYVKNYGENIRNWFFTSPDATTASQYGNATYAVFPVDGFQWFFHPSIIDVYTEFFLENPDNIKQFNNIGAQDADVVISKLMKNHPGHLNEEFRSALQGSSEVLLKAKGFYLVNRSSEEFQQLKKDLYAGNI